MMKSMLLSGLASLVLIGLVNSAGAVTNAEVLQNYTECQDRFLKKNDSSGYLNCTALFRNQTLLKFTEDGPTLVKNLCNQCLTNCESNCIRLSSEDENACLLNCFNASNCKFTCK